MSEPITLYIDYLSQPSRATLAFFLFNKIPHKVQEIRVVKGQHLQPEFRKINPFRQVPVIDDNAFILQESHAILRYLAETRKVPDHWYPKDPKRRALVDRYLDWHHANTRRCARYFQAAFKDVFPPGYITWTTESLEKPVGKILKTFEEVFLKDGKYLNGESEMTIADISAACEIMQLKKTHFDFSRFPVLEEWLNKCMAHQEMIDAHSVISKVLAKPKL